jgi:hypothetical protein
MSNLSFFKACLNNEFNGTFQLFNQMPNDNLHYSPHSTNRSARDIMEHILAHLVDLKVIIESSNCDETLSYDFKDSIDAGNCLEKLWKEVAASLEKINDDAWDTEVVALTISGNPFVSLPRFQMMWFFFFDIIHHRGQLSAYIRPMGGKNPAIYGYSADTI